MFYFRDHNLTTRFVLVWRIYLITLSYFIGIRTILLFLNDNFNLNSIDIFISIYRTGWFYDTTIILCILLPVSLYLWLIPDQWWKTRWNTWFLQLIVFLTIFSLGIIAVAEYFFWDELGARFEYVSVDHYIYRREVTGNIPKPTSLPLFFIVVFLISLIEFWFIRPVILRVCEYSGRWFSRSLIATANLFIVVVSISVLGQGLHDRQVLTFPEELSSNEFYGYIVAFWNNQPNYSEFYQKIEHDIAGKILRYDFVEHNAALIDPSGIHIDRQSNSSGEEKPINIILIMMESLSVENFGLFGDMRGLTPNLDSLSKQSLSFTRMYTTNRDAPDPVSDPQTPGHLNVKRIGRKSNMFALGMVLQEKDYTTKFIYGGNNHFDNLSVLFSSKGYSFLDLTTVPEEEILFKNTAGMADENLFNQVVKSADHIHNTNQPFFFHVITAFNQSPYTYPADRIDIPSGTGQDGAAKYADWAIGDFLNTAKSKPWFNNTVFVIIVDYVAGKTGKNDMLVNKYHTPTLIYAPEIILPEQNNLPSSEIDLTPTLLSILKEKNRSRRIEKDSLADHASEGRALNTNYQDLSDYTQRMLSILSYGKGNQIR